MARLQVRLQPRARDNRIIGIDGDGVRIRVTAPAIDGRANEALIVLLASMLDVAKSQICIDRGHTSRCKLIEVAGLSDDLLQTRLLAVIRSKQR